MAAAKPQCLCSNCSVEILDRMRNLKSLFNAYIQSSLPEEEKEQYESTMARIQGSLANLLSEDSTRQFFKEPMIAEFFRNLLTMPVEDLKSYLSQPERLRLLTDPKLCELLLHPALKALLYLSGVDTSDLKPNKPNDDNH